MPNESASLEEEWLPSRLILVDRSEPLIDAWRVAFDRFAEIEILAGDYFQTPADAIVSPANSFGIMDGGLDLAIRDELGRGVQHRLQQVILDRYHGELPIGSAEIVDTNDDRWKYLVAAPTMRIPESVEYTLNAYLAFRAILVAIELFNRERGMRAIDSLVCCGLATGIGRMPPERCAAQMRIAYLSMLEGALIGRYESIHERHRLLKGL